MRKIAYLLALILIAPFVWYIASRLSSDAISMGLGIIFGVLAGIPVLILVVAFEKNKHRHEMRMLNEPKAKQEIERRQEFRPPVVVYNVIHFQGGGDEPEQEVTARYKVIDGPK